MARKMSLMRKEILEIPAAVERLLSQGTSEIARAASRLHAVNPRFAITAARGSSDHVCTFLKYATELLHGVPVASIGPSIASIYHATLKLEGSVCISVSQSGKSPDIVELVGAAKKGGALAVSITNDTASPLAAASDFVLNIHAGPERSVAATKTFVTSAVAGLVLLAQWRRDDELLSAIRCLPGQLERAARLSWPQMLDAIRPSGSLFTLGRGPASAISNEAALKFKEICQLHAESYSSAEVLHGPVSIVETGFPVIVFAAADMGEEAAAAVADHFAKKEARVFITSERARHAAGLEHVRTRHPLTDPISLVTSFYSAVESVAAAWGIDPDAPRHLGKVTETV